VEEWHIPMQKDRNELHRNHGLHTVTALTWSVLATLLWFRKPLHSISEGMCHFSTCPPNITTCNRFCQVFSHVSNKINAGMKRPRYIHACGVSMPIQQ